MILKKVAVIGYPVKHSLSPALHGFWLDKYKDELAAKDIEGSYEAVEVKPEELEAFLLNMGKNGYVGCNVTVPHKEAVFSINSGSLDAPSILTGAVNTIIVDKNDPDYLHVSNTDIYGFLKNIEYSQKKFDFTKGKAVIIGAGGAARAVIVGLIEKNVPEIVIVNRTRERAEEIKKHIESINNDKDFLDSLNGWNCSSEITIADWNDRDNALKDANLLINSTKCGMEENGKIPYPLDVSLEKLPKDALVTDIVYKPLETRLLKDARAKGNKTVDGLGMLLYQAVAGFEMWFGIRPEVTEDLRESMLRTLNS